MPQLGIPAANPAIEHGWAVFLLPYLEQDNLFKQYRFDRDWRAPQNLTVRETFLKVMACPSITATPRFRSTSSGGFTWRAVAGDYAVNNAIDLDLRDGLLNLIDNLGTASLPYQGAMPINQILRIADIRDGTSNTMPITEDAGRPQRWRAGKVVSGTTSGAGWADRDNEYITHGFQPAGTPSPGPCHTNCTNDNENYSFHIGGANGLFADGSVRFYRESMTIRIMGRIITRSGGEVVDANQL
jgi:prepilin-type processing-associated H-X9-DG protein